MRAKEVTMELTKAVDAADTKEAHVVAPEVAIVAPTRGLNND